jgi:acylphosphatase
MPKFIFAGVLAVSSALHIKVKGRVQGVGFRASTQKQALKLRLSGFVRNLPDGDVEIVALGDHEAVQQLAAWCHKGPVFAKVTEVIVNPHDLVEIYEDFQVR